MLKFVCPLIAVEDVAVARRFYEECLGQVVRYDFGEDVEFAGGFSIHQKAHFQRLLGDAGSYPVAPRANWGELYFQTEDLDAALARVRGAGVEFIHEVQEMPWGQRCMRFYDPDGHVIEVGEAMEAVVARLYGQGKTVAEIVEAIGMPEEFVRGVVEEVSLKV
jgi:catechol 2,3-dioxygenase-like lactoylglutathione lyase family enzyme